MNQNAKETIRHLGNKLQAILGYLELDEHDKAIRIAKEMVAELHRIKAVKAAKETVAQLHNMKAALHSPKLKLPKNAVIVAPHGSRVVSHDDVNVDVDSDEVRIVPVSDVRAGQGTHNPKTR